MSLKEVLIDIIIPLISGFIGGSIGSVVIIKNKYSSIGTIKKDNRKVNNKNVLFLIVLSYDGFWFFAMISLIYAIGYEVIRYNSSTYVMFLLFISIMDIVVIPQITKIFKKKLIQ